MPEISTSPSGSADSALAWYTRSLAKVIGLSTASHDLQPEQLGDISTHAQREQIADLIGRRFRKSTDAASGVVSFELVGDAQLYVEDEEEGADPVMVNVSRGFLEGARAAIESINPGLCLPEICPDHFAGLLRETRTTIDLLVAESRRSRDSLQLMVHLHQLTDAPNGLLNQLAALFPCEGEAQTLDEANATAAIAMTREAVEAFDRIVSGRRKKEAPITQMAQIVRRCAGHVPILVQRARRDLREAGIGECELRAYEITLTSRVEVRGELPGTVSLGECLHGLEHGPARWSTLMETGRPEQMVMVQEQAAVMFALVDGLERAKLSKDLNLRPPASDNVAASMDRMFTYLKSLLRTIAPDRIPPARRPRGPRQPAPPASERAPMQS